MRTSRDGFLPQVELGPRLGGAKRLFERSGIVSRLITMVSAMTAAWSTSETVRTVFFDSFTVFILVASLLIVCWMGFDYIVLLPSEQSFNQIQSQRAERSPMKRDTEELLDRAEVLGHKLDAVRTETAADGGESDGS